jgi:hypothetical protein
MQRDAHQAALDTRVLKSVVEELAVIPRLATSAGERHAAALISERFSGLGWEATIEDIPAYRSYAWPIGLLCAGSLASAALGSGSGRRRWIGVAGGLLCAAGIVDDITGGPMWTRRLFMRRRRSQNVVARKDTGGSRTFCVVAHHDAAPSGFVFRKELEIWLAGRHPQIVQRLRSNPPIWWLVIAGPVLVAAGSALDLRRLTWLGVAFSATSLLALVDIGHRGPVPGANDNLSGVAALIGAAGVLDNVDVANLNLLFVSMGAEETLQGGIRAFAAAHFSELPVRSTDFLILDTVGFGHLVLLEGEGPVRMHTYDAAFKDFITDVASSSGIPLTRGLRSRNSTDAVVPQRYGFKTACVVSVDERKLMPHYHLDSDTPEHLDYTSVRHAALLILAIVDRLRSDRAPSA